MAKCLNIIKVLESACTLLNPATSEEWLCLYNTSRELRNPLIHRRVMLTFIKKGSVIIYNWFSKINEPLIYTV